MGRSSVSPGRAATLESLPPEISQRFLGLCDPVDVAAFAQTSSANHAFVYHSYDQVLWRELFLELFDDPRLTDPATAPLWSRTSKLNLWQTQLCERIRARQILRGLKRALIANVESVGGNTDPDNIDIDNADFEVVEDPREFGETLKVLVHVLDTARANPDPLGPGRNGILRPEERESRNVSFIEGVLDHPLLRKLVWDHAPSSVRQSAAKLHVHYGMSDWDLTTVRGRGLAREKVYLLSNYNEKNRWGPYVHDYTRTPNWEQLEAMMLVVGRNVNDRVNDWRLPDTDMPKMGLWHARNHTMTIPSGPKAPIPVQGDWAGVTGRWYRVVCFMDYRDLWGYNYGDFLSYNPDFLATYQEAVRVMSFNLTVVSIGKPPADIGIRGANVQTPPLIRALTRSRHMQDGYFPPTVRDEEEEEQEKSDDEGEDAAYEEVEKSRPVAADLAQLAQLSQLAQLTQLAQLSPMSRRILTTSPTSSLSTSSAFSALFSSSPSSSSSASPKSAQASASSKQPTLAQEYPPIYFSGTVQSSDTWHPTSYVHGRVERNEDGTVYWKLTSNYDGQDRWVSEGVQIGGMESKMGVFGIWSDAFHEHEGPAGPFWFWKGAGQ
ncbi:hypothetical protein CALVIDRAFT_540549 [Calocera viscosa TUFC12733]|uniref:F-box domain-containing protein n=1 Tax=Calocera viscosa (strain TUFC12733) TaxID=1330018 RepID=A0A167IR46_CALVF|nr:hypothetical protein CALVIDRAFT_540549 [Calocera viscosa TUFC12733]